VGLPFLSELSCDNPSYLLHGHGSPLAELALRVLYAVGLRVEVGADAALEHVAGFGLQVALPAVCGYCDCDVFHCRYNLFSTNS